MAENSQFTDQMAAKLQSPEMLEFATRIYNAARSGDMATFEQALPAGLPANMTNEKGDSLLMLASYHGQVDLTDLLLKHGADANILNDRGQSPLAGAIFKKEDEVARLLLEHGADPDLGDPSAAAAVHIFKADSQWNEAFQCARQKIADNG